MDAEKTMEFILQQQAKAEGQMAAIRKLIQTGMRMIVKQGENINKLAAKHEELAATQKELAASQKELAKSQKVTEAKLQALIDALRRGSNGHHSKN